MSEYSYKGEIGFNVYEFPGCCGICVVCNGTTDDEEIEDSLYLDGFDDFLLNVVGGEGVILFTDNPGGPLYNLYDMLDPSGTRWEKKLFCEFKNPNSGNDVVIKALVRT